MKRNAQREDCTEQFGTVIESREGVVSVHIEQKSACANCHARNMCTSMDKQDKVIEVATSDFARYQKGERVKVSITQRLGLRAVLFAFLIPFAVLLALLLACFVWLGLNEALSCLVAVAGVAVYYFGLYLLRDRLGKQFVFSISSCD